MIKPILVAIALATVAPAAFAQTAPATAPASAPMPTINSSIKDLLANPATAAILEKHLPGISQHPALPQFQDNTLPQVAPMSGGAVTQAKIDAIDADLKALPHP